MRKLLILGVVFATVLTTSCSKDEIDDFTNPGCSPLEIL